MLRLCGDRLMLQDTRAGILFHDRVGPVEIVALTLANGSIATKDRASAFDA